MKFVTKKYRAQDKVVQAKSKVDPAPILMSNFQDIEMNPGSADVSLRSALHVEEVLGGEGFKSVSISKPSDLSSSYTSPGMISARDRYVAGSISQSTLKMSSSPGTATFYPCQPESEPRKRNWETSRHCACHWSSNQAY